MLGEIFPAFSDLTRVAVRRAGNLLRGPTGPVTFVLDPEGRIASWSADAKRMTGYAAEDVVGSPLSILCRDEDVREGRPALALRIASTGRFEERGWRVCKDGTHVRVHTTITAIVDIAGERIGYISVMRRLAEPVPNG